MEIIQAQLSANYYTSGPLSSNNNNVLMAAHLKKASSDVRYNQAPNIEEYSVANTSQDNESPDEEMI